MPEYAAARLFNFMSAIQWPTTAWPAQHVRVGRHTTIRLVPHPGEFDAEAIVRTHMKYERSVFTWLEPRVASYGAIIEIGANVGAFTVFFAACLRSAGRSDTAIWAFEPSPRAFDRLRENVRVNGAEPLVRLEQAAVSDRAGTLTFYEPQGHLTNGSLIADFARSFSGDVRTTEVRSVTGDDIAPRLPADARLLVKIDAEGAEPAVLRGLAGLIDQFRPDIVVEILPETVDAISRLPLLTSGRYTARLITEGGVIDRTLASAGTDERDWWLTP